MRDALHECAEHLEALALPLGERILLAHRPQVDALLEVVHLLEVLAPALVDDAEHDLALDLAHDAGAELGLPTLVVGGRVGDERVAERVAVGDAHDVVAHEGARPEGLHLEEQPVDVPLVVGLGDAVHVDEVGHRLLHVLERRGLEVAAREDLVAAPVHDLALLVHDLVVLEDVLADLRVALLDRGLRALDRLGDHLGLDGLVVREGAAHHPRERARGEESHELVVEAEVEAALARVALAAGAAAQLVVDAAALVALGAEHVEAAELAHAGALLGAARVEAGAQLGEPRAGALARRAVVGRHRVERRGEGELVDERQRVVALLEHLLAGEAVRVAPEEDVDAATRHVGRHGDGADAARLRDDDGLAGVLLGVEDLVADAAGGEHAREELALFHADRADEDRLALGVALLDVAHDGVELGPLALVDEVGMVATDHRAVGRDRHDLQPVGVHQLGGLGLRGAGHARELLVHAEVVLQRDGGERLVLLLDRDALLGLHRLVDALAPAATLEDAAGELVDDLHLAVLDDVVLVAVVEHPRLEGHLQLVHQVLLDLVVEVVDLEGGLDLLDARLGRHHDALVLLDLEVDVALEAAHDGGEAVVELGRVGDAARDDERGAGLVDEDRVDLVDDREVVAALDLVLGRARHVVAQVVEAELVVGPVGDVAGVVGALVRRGRAGAGHDEPDREAEPAVDAAHPLGVAAGEVVVDRHDVHAAARQRVEVHGQGGDQGLALAGAHLGDPARVERGAAHDLDVVVALADDAARGLAHDGEGLDHDVVDPLAARDAAAELRGLGPQGVVAQPPDGVAEGVDLGDDAREGLDLLALAGAQDAVEDRHRNDDATAAVVTSTAPFARSARDALRNVAPVVTTSSTISTRAPTIARAANAGPVSRLARVPPVCTVRSVRRSVRLHGTRNSRATRRATISAASKPRRRARDGSAATKVTTSGRGTRPAATASRTTAPSPAPRASSAARPRRYLDARRRARTGPA